MEAMSAANINPESSSGPLFACSRCYSRHPFEELSAGQQLCKKCRGDYPVVKCTYCRSEFQQTLKGGTKPICKKCECNIKMFGKPATCEYCSIIAAFIGTKCQRCTNSEKKYGPPVTCQQCKQKCAFDRKDEDKKVDGKLLCWLCTLSYKRAVAKSKSTDPTRHSHVKLSSNSKHKEPKRPYDKKPQRVDVTKLAAEAEPPMKKSATSLSSIDNKGSMLTGVNVSNSGLSSALDVGNSDHVVVVTQLREKISNLQKQLSQKNQQMLGKDRQITELRAQNFTTETECRNKMKSMQREHESKVQDMTVKLKQAQKEIAVLSKAQKNKSSLTIVRSAASSSFMASEKNNNNSTREINENSNQSNASENNNKSASSNSDSDSSTGSP